MPSKVLLLNLGSQWSTQHVEQLVANAYGVLQEAAPAGLKCGLHAIPGSNQVCTITCPSGAAATELSAALEAYGQLPYILIPGETDAAAKQAFYCSRSCPATCDIDCAQFLEGRRCRYACSINEGKGLRLPEECCPFRHPVGSTDACSMWQAKVTCAAGSRCSKRHPHALLLQHLQQRFRQRPPPEPVVLPWRAAARIPEVAPAPPAPASFHARPAWQEPDNSGRRAAGARPPPRAQAARRQQAPVVAAPATPPARPARPEPAAQAAPAAAAAAPSAAGRHVAAGRNPTAGTELCPHAGCMNPACPNRHRNEQQRLNTIEEILAPEQLLRQPAIPTEVKQICGRLHSRLHALTADSKPPAELRTQLLSVVDAFDQARSFPALPYHAYDGVQTQCRKLAEGIVKTLLHNQGVVTEHFELAAGIGPDNNLKGALHVLRGYGNDGSHYSMTNPMPMMQHRCDVLVLMGSMAAYAYDKMLQQLL